MKKQFVIFIASILPLVTTGQNTFKQEIAVGGSFGMGVSTVSFNNPKVYTKMMMGSHAGLTARWVSQKNLGLILEVNYSQQGWEGDFADVPAPEGEPYEYSRRVNFIDIPFMTHIYFGSERFRFFFNLGPKIGFAIGESLTENISGRESSLPSSDPNYQYVYTELAKKETIDKKFAWGLCGGPGLELRTKIGIFQLEGRYYYGLGDLFDNRASDKFNKSASQAIYGKLTYLIPLFKK